MNKHLLRTLALLFPLLLLGSCTFARQKINVEHFHEKSELVIPGETKAAELVDILGSPPNAVLPLKDGRVFVYTFGEGKTKGLTLILLNITKTNVGIDSGYFFIDRNDTVEEKIISNNSKDLAWEWWAFGD